MSVRDPVPDVKTLRPSRERLGQNFWLYLAADAQHQGRLAVTVVAKPRGQRGFAVLPRRWVIERSFAWLDRRRRLNKHHEGLLASATALCQMAMVETLLRRLARS